MSHIPMINSGIVPASDGSYENPSRTAAPSQAFQNGNNSMSTQGSNQSTAPIHQSSVNGTYSQPPIHGVGHTPLHQTTNQTDNTTGPTYTAGDPTPLHQNSNHPQAGEPDPTPLHPHHHGHPVRPYVEPGTEPAPPLPPRQDHGYTHYPPEQRTTTRVGGLDGRYHDLNQTSTSTQAGTEAHIPHPTNSSGTATNNRIPHPGNHPETAQNSASQNHSNPPDARTTSEKLRESASGVGGLVAAVHGAGERLRGGFNREVDRAFGDKIGEEKNSRIVDVGATEIHEGKVNRGSSRRTG